MLIKVSEVTPAMLRRLEVFGNSQNWVSCPKNTELGFFGKDVSNEDRREVEHPFAKLLRKTRDSRQPGRESYNITLEISPYIYDMGGNRIKVPLSFLAGLMQALDLFSEDFEPIDLELV